MTDINPTIKSVQFGIFSPYLIKKHSVLHVLHPETLENGLPKENGLSDSRMGVIDNSLLCATCYQNCMTCQGHFGHIELCKPVFHVNFLNRIKKVLECVCYYCSSIKNSKNTEIRVLKNSLSFLWQNNKTKLVCDVCQQKQPVIRKEGMNLLAFMKGSDSEGKMILTAEKAYSILKKISDDDIVRLGFNLVDSRPEWMILTTLLVSPPSCRPAVQMDNLRGEDDLTHKYADIIKANNNLRRYESDGAPSHILRDYEQLLQFHVATLMDNEISGQPQALQKNGRPLKSLSARLKGKEGRLRYNLMGKRVDFSARTVITPDPNISLDEVGVPLSVAMTHTFGEVVNTLNYEKLKELVKNGPMTHPGANYVVRTDGQRIDLKFVRSEVSLLPGYIVERHLQNGDVVLFNRQPSLHKMSMMAHRVRVMDKKTFRLNLSVTTPYNADFDGDEMNLHAPQSLLTVTELKELASVVKQIVSPQSNRPVMGIVQDSLIGVRRLTSDDTFIEMKEAMQIFFSASLHTKKDDEPIEGSVMSNVASKGNSELHYSGSTEPSSQFQNTSKNCSDQNTKFGGSGSNMNSERAHNILNNSNDAAIDSVNFNTDISPSNGLTCNSNLQITNANMAPFDALTYDLNSLQSVKLLVSPDKMLSSDINSLHIKSAFMSPCDTSSYDSSYEDVSTELSCGSEMLKVLSREAVIDGDVRSLYAIDKVPEHLTLPHKLLENPKNRTSLLRRNLKKYNIPKQTLLYNESSSDNMSESYAFLNNKLSKFDLTSANECCEDIQSSTCDYSSDELEIERVLPTNNESQKKMHFIDQNTKVSQVSPAIETFKSELNQHLSSMTPSNRFQRSEHPTKNNNLMRCSYERLANKYMPQPIVCSHNSYESQERPNFTPDVFDYNVATPSYNTPSYSSELQKNLVISQSSRENKTLLGTKFSNNASKMPKPTFLRPTVLYTGKQIFSWSLPKINFKTHSTEEKPVLIVDGILHKGVIDKKSVGTCEGGIIHIIFNDFGSLKCRQFFDFIQRIVCSYMFLISSFSVGIGDTVPSKLLKKEIISSISSANEEVNKIIADPTKISRQPGMSLRETFESFITMHLNKARNISGSFAQKELRESNNVKQMVLAGSKGSLINISQMTACVGQQNVEGKRIPFGFRNRTLPHFTKDDYSARSRGFVKNSYLTGLTPEEFFFHAMGGREGLIDTAVKTAETGYIQRRLVKAMEDLKISFDGSVRAGNGALTQFMYGDDGLKGEAIERSKPITLKDLTQDLFDENDYNNSDESASVLNLVDKVSIKSAFTAHTASIQTQISDSNRKIIQALLKNASKELKKNLTTSNILNEELEYLSNLESQTFYMPLNMHRVFWNAKRKFQSNICDLTLQNYSQAISDLFEFIKTEINKYTSSPQIITYIKTHLTLCNLLKHKINQSQLTHIVEITKERLGRSLAPINEMVGTLAAQSVGEPATQMTLNTFHFAGVASTVTLGVPRLKEIINIAKTLKTPSMKLYLLPEYAKSIIDAKKAQIQIEYAEVKDVLCLTQLIYEPNPESTIINEDKDFVETYFELLEDYEKAFEKMYSNYVIRLVLSREKLVGRGITIQDVVDKLKTFNEKPSTKKGGKTAGEIQIDRSNVDTKTENDEDNLAYTASSQPRTCFLTLDQHTDPVSITKVSYLNIVSSDENADSLVIRIRTLEKTQESTFDVLNKILKIPLGGYRNIKKVFVVEEMNKFVLQTEGINLKDLLSCPILKTSKIHSNSIIEVYEVLGIEAARAVILKELRSVIENEGYVNIRHLMLLADVMTVNGILCGITRHGVNRNEKSALMRCSFEETVEILMEAAIVGEKSACKEVTESIILGQNVPIGTGLTELFLNTDILMSAIKLSDKDFITDVRSPVSSFSPISGMWSPIHGNWSPIAESSPLGRSYSPNNSPSIMSPVSPSRLNNPLVQSPGYQTTSPQYASSQFTFSPRNFNYMPTSPGNFNPIANTPNPLQYAPTSPNIFNYAPTSPTNFKYSPTSPTSTAMSSNTYTFAPTSPLNAGIKSSFSYSPTSPKNNAFSPSYYHTVMSPTKNTFSKKTNLGYSPTSPTYTKTHNNPLSPSYSPSSKTVASGNSNQLCYSPTYSQTTDSQSLVYTNASKDEKNIDENKKEADDDKSEDDLEKLMKKDWE